MDIESSSSGGGGGGSEVVHVTTAHLIATALPLVLIAAVGHHFDLGIENGLTVGIVRSFLQLMILGMILQPIFVLGMDMSWVVGLCELCSSLTCCCSLFVTIYIYISSILDQSQMYLQ
jgi:ABC-type iron transport system FetAB permease component